MASLACLSKFPGRARRYRTATGAPEIPFTSIAGERFGETKRLADGRTSEGKKPLEFPYEVTTN